MDIRRYIALAAAAALTAPVLAACGKKNSTSGSEPPVQIADTTAAVTTKTVQPPSEVYPEYPVSYPEIEEKDTGDLYEAEKAHLKGTLATEYDKENYSGEGYITGFNNQGTFSVVFGVNIPSNQHYDISFNIAASSEVTCRMTINGGIPMTFKTKADGNFTEITLHGIFLTKGSTEIELCPENGNICLDYLKLRNSDTLGGLSYDAKGELSNENSGESAKKLMSFLTDNYGKYIITGQYAADNDDSELDLIYSTTGKYPVIRFTDFRVPKGSYDESFKRVEACADWYRNGGISGVSWYWSSPSEKSSIYTEESDFDLSKAVTDIDISQLTQEEIRGLYGEGNISEQTYSLILDIDNMAGQLTSLKNKGVPVLWRPLPEGSGDWYWWGASGSKAYKWLWNLLYQRLTGFFELDNLIWIWNGQSESTLVDKSTYDIAAADLYINDERDYGDRFYEKFAGLQKTAGKDKLIAISECGSVPDADSSFRDNAVWSFFVLWHGKYIENEDGTYSADTYTSKQSLVRLYNSAGALTLDEYREMTGYVEPAKEEPSTGENTSGTETETETEGSEDETETAGTESEETSTDEE